MSALSPVVVLFCIAIAVALAVRPLRVPYAVALVIVGLALAAAGLIAPPHLTKDLLFSVFLPGLLFDASFHLDSSVFGRLWLGITGLAIPGVVAAIALTALIVSALLRGLGIAPNFTWSTGLVFAALIAATDPVAVTAVLRHLRMPSELLTLVEGESLLNDGTAVVFLSLVLGYVAGTPTSGAGLLGQFLLVAGGGVAVGLATGGVIAMTIRRLDDPMIEIALTTIAGPPPAPPGVERRPRMGGIARRALDGARPGSEFDHSQPRHGGYDDGGRRALLTGGARSYDGATREASRTTVPRSPSVVGSAPDSSRRENSS